MWRENHHILVIQEKYAIQKWHTIENMCNILDILHIKRVYYIQALINGSKKVMIFAKEI